MGRFFFGAALVYGFISFLFANLVYLGEAHSNNAVKFYTDHFSKSFYGLDQIDVVGRTLRESSLKLFSVDTLFFLAFLLIATPLLSFNKEARNASLGAALWIAFPLVMYSFDRFAVPQPRYFMLAVPMLAYSMAALLKSDELRSKASTYFVLLMMLGLSMSARDKYVGVTSLNLEPGVLQSRLDFLDFEEANAELNALFHNEDVIIVNHSLPTGYLEGGKFLYTPRYDQFLEGDNTELDGIILVYGLSPPNSFFFF